MKIRNIDLDKYPIFLAPMEDVTDPAFRLMCKKFGADMVYTEFVSADALIRSVGKTMQKLNINDEERPVAVQIYGRDTETMAEAAKIVEEAHPDILDINFGCPVKRVAGKGAGAGMLQNIPLMLEITRAVVDAVKIPVTVKTRLGWDNEHKIIVDLAEQLQDCGIEALTIHGRTRAQMYTGEADWSLIGEVKKNPRMHIPIIGNGDITTPQRAKECFDLYGVDAIMIGRASFGRPWIFKEIKHYIETGKELPALSFEWRLNVLRQEVLDSVNAPCRNSERAFQYFGLYQGKLRNELLMLQYINVPIGCAVFRMAIGTLTYWHIVALTHYLFYFTQTSFRREINVFRIALISHLTTTGCFRSQRTGHITFHITRGTGTSSYIYRFHTFCLYIPTTTGSIRSVLTNTYQNYISGRAGISRYISSVQILDRYITRTTGISREICTRYLFQNHITRTISGSRKIITRNNASCYITATASLNSNFPTRFQSILYNNVTRAGSFQAVHSRSRNSYFLFMFSVY